uniref:P-type conjugative transfer protein TrbG n=1 Tax=Caulobacter sp. (strain K31) TaxID=366602 RepID=B0T9G0_CAUSK
MSTSRITLRSTAIALLVLAAGAGALGPSVRALAQGPSQREVQGPAAAPPALSVRPAAQIAPAKAAATTTRPASANTPSTPRPRARVTRTHRARAAASGPLATIARANAEARDWPRSAAYVNSALYYDFEPGRLYTIHTSPRFLTTITLKPGEKLIAKAAGDTVRWVLGETQSGAGEAAQVVIFVKPIRPDLRTNIILTTDQRTYLIDAVSNASPTYTSVLSWNYPQDLAREAAQQRQRDQALAATRTAVSVADAIPIDQLNFRYRVEPRKGRAPRWTPIRVFDDGAKTYIEFPADLATSEAPPLFLLGANDQAELVNYRQRGLYYVVDRLIDRAELRLGDKHQAVVRIARAGAAR